MNKQATKFFDLQAEVSALFKHLAHDLKRNKSWLREYLNNYKELDSTCRLLWMFWKEVIEKKAFLEP